MELFSYNFILFLMYKGIVHTILIYVIANLIIHFFEGDLKHEFTFLVELFLKKIYIRFLKIK